MKLQTLRRSTAAAAVVALSFTFAACGSEDDESGSDNTDTSSEAAPDTSDSADAPSEDTSSDAAGDDQFAAVFGSACSGLPGAGEPGSLDGMVTDPVGTAASTNPLLGTLVTAVQAVPGLLDTLNDESAQYTVFAPADTAFEKIPPADLQGLLDGAAEADSPLAQVLQHHVLAERVDPDAIDGEQTPLFGDALTIEGDPSTDPDGVTVTDGVATAKVLCGGIPTANATVYVIDTVLTGPLA
ncbi:fasciclin domain-containing protein [Nocardioides sp. C4-1]|uniref:fasciclin domain-containing protein n=1 Tax=Nocardioides sp. C4-1 TaxID=3151851 RepID=UPI003264F98C